MITDQFGNEGEYISKLTGDKCEAIDGKYDTNECYFDMAVRSVGVGNFGVPMHTLQEEQGKDTLGLPDKNRPMYIGDDLLNKCDVDNLNTCSSNNNCKINDSLKSNYDYLNTIINENENKATELNNVVGAKTYWNNKNACDYLLFLTSPGRSEERA